ncbi:MAG: DUF2306 domain-containing protein, partial [Rhodospirillaceae bacterium]|nr:DUF2306 domain-containing protein [Rhodospirillaceae bacterium]
MTAVLSHPAFRDFIALASLSIVAYAARYALLDETAFQSPLTESFMQRPWAIGLHAATGALGLLLCLGQMSRTLRAKRPDIHRWVGRITVPVAVTSGAAGLLLAVYSYGGWITHMGFGGLGVLTIACPILGWAAMRRKDVKTHRAWMLRTFLLLFAAVTLRIELPLLAAIFEGQFRPAYQIVSWLCWVPN